MLRLERKHPLAIRWFHWINFPVLSLMIWSGVMIYWASDFYDLGPIHFFPEWFYSALGLGRRLSEGMAWHFFIGWLFAINGVLYVLYTAISGEWRDLLPNLKSPGEAFQVVLHDLGIRKAPLPKAKFNAAQRITYTVIILMGLGSVVTGIAIYKPVQVSWLIQLLGGYPAARVEHFALTVGYVGFFFIHIAQVVRAGWNNFRSMVTGYELVDEATEESHG